jgi:hypothetical protein
MNLSPSPVFLPSNNRDRTNEFRTTVKTFATKRVRFFGMMNHRCLYLSGF